MQKIYYCILFSLNFLILFSQSTQLTLYDLWIIDDKETFGFISLTDRYNFSHNPDSFVIDPQYLGEEVPEFPKYHDLNDINRSRFLGHNGLNEFNKIFIYNFDFDTVLEYSVKNSPLMAFVSVYSYGDFQPSDYHIGYRIVLEPFLKELLYNSENLVYIGENNPFQVGRLKKMVCDKIAPFRYQSVDRNRRLILRTNNYKLKALYFYENTEFSYYIQFTQSYDSRNGIILHVVNRLTKELVFSSFYQDSESGYLMFTIDTETNKLDINLWTGALLKNQATILTDIKGYTFGCPSIYFFDEGKSSISIECDNRH